VAKVKHSCAVMRWFYLSKKLYNKKIPFFPQIIIKLIRVVFSCEISYRCDIGDNVILSHNGLGVVIHPDAKIGNDVKILQNVTIGGRNGRGAPKIGDNVLIGAGACILGDITIGDNAQIGANAVVIDNIPPGAVAVGIPAKVIKIVDLDKDK
jgi:serine O-acetyltransferase